MPPISETLRRSWNGFFFQGFSGDSLALLRIYLACALVLFHVVQFYPLLQLDPTGPGFYFVQPMWHFELLGIHSHVPWLTPIAFVLLIGATFTMAAGRWTRISIAMVLLCIFYLKGVRDSFTGDVHHRYLVIVNLLFLLLLSRCGALRSLDARRRDLPPVAEWEASWPIRAMQVYIVSFYFWSFLAKIRVTGWHWFAGGKVQELLLKRSVMWGVDEQGIVTSNHLAFDLAHVPELMLLLGGLTLVLEAGFPLILFMRKPRWRLLFLLGAAFFHLANFLLAFVGFLLLPIAFLVFFDLVPVHAWLRARFGRPPDPAPAPS